MVSAGINAQISSRISKSLSESNSKGLLFIQCFLTSKNMRHFKKLVLDPEKLKSVSNYYEVKNEKIKDIKERNKIFMITEATIGGVFNGFIEFSKSSVKSDSQEKSAMSVNAQIS